METGATYQRAPLELLAAASLLLSEQVDVRIVDGIVDDDPVGELLEECKDALCVGITAVVGYQVYMAAKAARAIRQAYPHLPVVWGGWFVSTSYKTIFDEDLCDICVIGQGEKTFWELFRALREKKPLDSIDGIAFKRNGEVCVTAPRQFTDLNDLPALPYHLIDLNRYFDSDPVNPVFRQFYSLVRGEEWGHRPLRCLTYYSSYGCPEGCAFCASPGVTARRYTALDADRMLDEIQSLHEQYQFDFIIFNDANFMVSKKRVEQFCHGLIERGMKLNWACTGESTHIAKYGDEFAKLLHDSGCVFLFVGGESGCEETLERINKKRRPEVNVQAAQILSSNGVGAEFSYIIGFPGEPESSMKSTIRQCCKIMQIPLAVPILRYFIPLPGALFYDVSIQQGYSPPTSTTDWGTYDLVFAEPIGYVLTRKISRKSTHFRDYYFRWFLKLKIRRKDAGLVQRIAMLIISLRLRLASTALPFEIWAAGFKNRLNLRRI